MVISTDEHLMSEVMDAKETTINEEVHVHRNELENITSYVEQKGHSVFE